MMAEPTGSIFTERATKKLRSPDDLDSYVRVTKPSMWVVLAACAVLLIGLFAWGFFGTVATRVGATGTRSKEGVVCFLDVDAASKVSIGDPAMGMQTLVSEGGGGVSGGQRQRVMIARAVCGRRRILMFDEATSALDNKTQKHVADSLANLRCTRIVVAHRLSTVRECDRILVVSDGRIAEEGSFDELIKQGGIFADLVERQRIEEGM